MSHRRTFIASLATVLAVTLLIAAGPRPADWKAVNDAIGKNLPKTAIAKLEPIIAQAMIEKRYAEAIKAISMKIALEGNIQGGKPEEKITRMRGEIEKAPADMKPAMEAVLANWFWHYFQQNRWRFMRRTQTSGPSGNDGPIGNDGPAGDVGPIGDDFTTWDLTRILSEIDKQFQKSLASDALLKQTPVADYDDLLEKGSAPDAYRPTLYDVLAHNALEFYSSGTQAGSRIPDAFELAADSPIFSSVDDFLGWEPATTDQDSITLKAVRLYQDLIRFHQQDDDPSALLDADLLRLNFANNRALGEEKSARYKAALVRFAAEHSEHEISARALHRLAASHYPSGDWVKAREIAQSGLARFPDSVGGRRCFNLIHQIEARTSRVTTERVWNDPQPTIDVHYRNVTKIHLRLVKFDFEQYVQAARHTPEQLDTNQQRKLLTQQPTMAWSVNLPATEDFQQRLERIEAPDDVPAGSYFLIASHNENFKRTDNQVTFCEVWVSDLAIVTRHHQGEALAEGFVLDAITGDPISGALVRGWIRNRRNQLNAIAPVRTDSNGLFRFHANNRSRLLIHAAHRGRSLSAANYLRGGQPTPNTPTRFQTVFFTDRSLYRPGQTIRYKGICMSVDQHRDNYRAIANRQLTVVFADVNGKEIQRQVHRTNDLGSFSGSVTAPRDRLMGRMTIRVDGSPPGQTQVSVEEYKRPKFQTSLEPPKEAAKLGGQVKLQGKATAYTGAAINDAKVAWRVVREVQYPTWWYWRCWWIPPQRGASQEMAHGTSVTSAGGTFDIDFIAKPDASVLETSEPTFRYTIHADVTDTSGETRSDSIVVNVGYTALSASMSAPDWLTDDKPVEIRVRTTTLDAKATPAKGVVKIHSLKQPAKVARATLAGQSYYRSAGGGGPNRDDPKPDPSNPNSWEIDETVFESNFETGVGGGVATVSTELASGIYRATLETTDRFGKAVTAMLPLQVLSPESEKLDIKLPNLVAAPKWSVQPGEQFMAVWGSGYDTARAFVEIEHRGKLLQSYWTKPGLTQVTIEQAINESMRGGFTLRTTMVRENRAYLHSQQVSVPWTNKQLTLKWEHFVSKLKPAEKETWTAVISGPDANASVVKASVAEMVATLYDASLDAYQPHHWQSAFGVFRHDRSRIRSSFQNQLKNLQQIYHNWLVPHRDESLTYRYFPPQITQSYYGNNLHSRGHGMRSQRMPAPAMAFGAAEMMMDSAILENGKAMMAKVGADVQQESLAGATAATTQQPASNRSPDLNQVSARKNLNETAFFFPQLISGDDGTVKLEFTMPEALTEWKFLGFAHDNQLRSGLLTGTTVTAKELMVQPNPPRFLREGDVVEFTVKVSNQSPTHQRGEVRLTFADARTGDSVDDALGNSDRDQAFDIPAGESMSLAWRLSVPDDLGFLTYKAVGSTGRLSDGEEGFLPVLSRRMLVTESLPLPIRGKTSKRFEFKKLLASGESDSLQNKSLTVQMVSNPSWYAVMALPYLMEYPHQCSEQTFNRLYANSIARHIAASDPKIHRVFEQWRATPALDSPLEKNQELKALLLEETPWVRQAQAESQARRSVGILFDDNRLDTETKRTLHQLSQMQMPDGAWPWFPGGRANDYITLYITTGFGRLRHLGVDIDTTAAIKSLARLDGWATQRYLRIKLENRDNNHLSATVALYLYGRSFFLEDQPIADQHREAFDFWVDQAKTHWIKLANRQSQAHLAVALKRLAEVSAAKGIMASIKERSVNDEEMGMFWRDTEYSWWWYRAPIETQAMMIEAFDEVMDDQTAVEDCKVWLLKQKQTQDWKTTKATADAVYALLLRGSDLLASTALVEVSLAGERVPTDDIEAGTGFYERKYVGAEIKPEQGAITLKKIDDGVAWGSLHWQYLEDISKITPHDDTPLKLTKQLFVKKNSDKGPTLVPVNGPVEVGDELVVRVILRSDRDMEYVHLKDYRSSGTEPVNVISRYNYQDGLGYYESTRDTATHFFIDYLAKGTYVFEYSVRVQLRGQYQTGIANIQCMYAPEFNSHSESISLQVK